MSETNGVPMSSFKQAMQSNPPRLVVLFRQGEDGTEQFQWGIVGDVRIMTLLGGIVEAQEKLINDWAIECDELAFVLLFGDEVSYWKHPDIPAHALVGFLETVKFSIINGKASSMTKGETKILGPDGSPMKFNRLKGI